MFAMILKLSLHEFLLLVSFQTYHCSMLNFAKLIECVVHRDPGDLLGYGCYCGKGGRNSSTDDIDRCCKIHDKCYSDARKGTKPNCSRNILPDLDKNPHAVEYFYTCLGDTDPKKRADRDKDSGVLYPGEATCNQKVNRGCAYTICECDLAVVKCFAEHDSSYNATNATCPAKSPLLDQILNRAAKWYTELMRFINKHKAWLVPTFAFVVIVVMSTSLWLLWQYVFVCNNQKQDKTNNPQTKQNDNEKIDNDNKAVS